MFSCLKYILGDFRGGPWAQGIVSCNNDVESYLVTLPKDDQLRFVLDQTIALSYFFHVYGSQAHALVTTYSKDLIAFTEKMFDKNTFDENVASIVQAVKDIQTCLYGRDWIDVPISDVVMFLFDICPTGHDKDALTPFALKKSDIVPYLMFRNHRVQNGYEVYPGEVTFPSYRFGQIKYGTNFGFYLGIYSSRIGTNFSANPKFKFGQNCVNELNVYASLLRAGFTYLPMVLLCDPVIRDFESLISDMGYRCLHRDQTRFKSGDGQLFYTTLTILQAMYSVDFIDVHEARGRLPFEFPECELPVSLLFQFIRVMNVHYGVKFRKRELFVRFFGNRCKDKDKTDIQKVIDFVACNGEKVASAEMLLAYKNSPLGSCEAIELISQRIPVVAQDPGSDETEEEPIKEDDEGDNLDLSDLPERDDAEPGLEADEVSPEDEDTSTDDDEGTDDSSSQEDDQKDGKGNTNADDDKSSSDDNSSSDDDEGTDESGDSSATTAANDTQAGSGKPEDIDASDKIGAIPFKVNPEGSETVDSVNLREELDQFISEVLVNPPKKLSPQTVRALTDLQKYWLHILSVETIMGITGALIELPERFKTITNTHGENS